jgi:C_GCAxxG_C_C family probable redox protein
MDNKFVNLNEEEKKNLIKRAADLGYKYEKMYGNCPQCTVAAIQEVFGIADDNIFKQVYGLGAGGGLTSKGTCGALAAGIVMISSIYGREKEQFSTGMNKECYGLSKKLLEKVEDYYGGILCHEIQKKIMNDSFNLNNEDELKAFEEAGGHEDKCPSVISQVVTFISEMIVDGEL